VRERERESALLKTQSCDVTGISLKTKALSFTSCLFAKKMDGMKKNLLFGLLFVILEDDTQEKSLRYFFLSLSLHAKIDDVFVLRLI
jgi:hypothetical protein